MKYLIVLILFCGVLSSCITSKTDIVQKHYPKPPYQKKQFVLTIRDDNKIKQIPLSFKKHLVKFVKEEYIPKHWELPNQKNNFAIPKFSDPTQLGLMMEVYLEENDTDGVLLLCGKYTYKFINGFGRQNVYICDKELERYNNILNLDICTYKSTFYIVKFALDEEYEVIIVNTAKKKKSIYLTVAEKNK